MNKTNYWLSLVFFILALSLPHALGFFRQENIEKPAFFKVQPISEYYIKPIQLGKQQELSLGTSNIFNGHYFDGKSNRISVFTATWNPQQGTGEELYHTPDICWVLQGFKNITIGEDSFVDLNLHGKLIRFQCRILQSPNDPLPEIVLWAASLNGRWDVLNYCRAPMPPAVYSGFSDYIGDYIEGLKSKFLYTASRVANPSTIGVSKQFIRVSKSLTGEWGEAVSDLHQFICKWLEIENSSIRPNESIELR